MSRMGAGGLFRSFAIIVALCAFVLFPAHFAYAQDDATSKLEINSVADIMGKRICMVAGSAFDQLLLKNYQGVSQDDISYYNNNAEMIGALKASKSDVMIADLPIAQLAVNRNDGVGIVPEPLVEDRYAFVLPKGSAFTAQMNERLSAYREDGTIEKLYQKWTGTDDSAKVLPAQDWPTPNGTLKVMAAADNEPMAYLSGDEASGMCIELMYLIARDKGYGLEIGTNNVGSLMADVQSGKADIAAANFSITEERKKMVDMTEPFYDGGVVAVVRTATPSANADQGFFEGIAASFERTFITEDRWQMILTGLGVTLLMALVSGVLGLALGFLLLLRRGGNRVAESIIGGFEGLMGGLPVVVVLMVFYYIVFGAIDMPGVIVAIIVFTLLFAASSGSIMWNAIKAVDPGQAEAGRAIGFSDRETFFLIVLPQAARQFAPLLRAQFVTLVKDTSIVGYIAVQDLTRVGDIIRARTMEAFFPLIAIAAIYFVLCWLLAKAIDHYIKRLEPSDGPRTIEGVDLR